MLKVQYLCALILSAYKLVFALVVKQVKFGNVLDPRPDTTHLINTTQLLFMCPSRVVYMH